MLGKTAVGCAFCAFGVLTCGSYKALTCSDNKGLENSYEDPVSVPGELVFSQVVFRHGARTPVYEVKGDSSWWNLCSPQVYDEYLFPVDIVSSSPSNPNPVEDDSPKENTPIKYVCF